MQRARARSLYAAAWLLLLVLIGTTAAAADRSFRCNGKIVSVGSYKDQVLRKCGEPDYVEQWEVGHDSAIAEYFDYEKERFRLPRLIIGPLYMERWTYDLGSNQFIRYLLFRNGELIKIETGEKGAH
ncbi:MAG: DUF2845 domain-containing protein [Desulfobacteraceae bacterium]|nr:MAG: DUF2845 domain-containing protein [Desulfobacteraceae bacterium]